MLRGCSTSALRQPQQDELQEGFQLKQQVSAEMQPQAESHLWPQLPCQKTGFLMNASAWEISSLLTQGLVCRHLAWRDLDAVRSPSLPDRLQPGRPAASS